MLFGALAFGGLQLQVTAGVPEHMQFSFKKEGIIQMKHKRKLRLNVKGGALEHGDPIVLWNAQESSHVQFEEKDGSIKLMNNPTMCLNIEGGLVAGSNLVTWPCRQSHEKSLNEDFKFGRGKMKGRIHPRSDSSLCLNVKGGAIEEGAEVVLWHCEEGHDHEKFIMVGNRITVMDHPELHFNVAGGDLSTPGVKIVLYKRHASANEVFKMSEGRIHLQQRTDLCLNAEGGLSAGHRIVVWPCSPEPEENELFYFDEKTGAIHSSKEPELAFNAAGGGMILGDEIVLWSTKEEL